MLTFCKASFENFFNDPPPVNVDVNDENYEKEIGRIKKLFGNIEFCGELYKHRILAESTLWSVFDGLLGLNTGEKANKSINDNTVEAAIKLITKLGPNIDEKLKRDTWADKNKEFTEKIFKQFEYLMNASDRSDDKLNVSQRLQFLIKNMMANKESGWSKTKNKDSEIKTKEQVQEEVYKQAAMAEEAQKQEKRGDYYDAKSSGKSYDNKRGMGGRQDSRKEGKPVYLEKKPSHNEPATPDIMKGKGQKFPQSKLAQSAVYSSGLENKSPMPKGKGKRNAAEKTVIQPEEEQCLIKSFTNFAKAKDEFFNTIGENPTEETIAEPELNFDHILLINADRLTPENKPVGGLLICKLLESLFDKKESEFSAYFGTWLEKLIAAKIFYGKDLE